VQGDGSACVDATIQQAAGPDFVVAVSHVCCQAYFDEQLAAAWQEYRDMYSQLDVLQEVCWTA